MCPPFILYYFDVICDIKTTRWCQYWRHLRPNPLWRHLGETYHEIDAHSNVCRCNRFHSVTHASVDSVNSLNSENCAQWAKYSVVTRIAVVMKTAEDLWWKKDIHLDKKQKWFFCKLLAHFLPLYFKIIMTNIQCDKKELKWNGKMKRIRISHRTKLKSNSE